LRHVIAVSVCVHSPVSVCRRFVGVCSLVAGGVCVCAFVCFGDGFDHHTHGLEDSRGRVHDMLLIVSLMCVWMWVGI
jgi:hypothetical protein